MVEDSRITYYCRQYLRCVREKHLRIKPRALCLSFRL